MLLKSVAGVLLVVLLGACASIPPATIQYYPPKADIGVSVVQTVACNKQKTRLFYANAVTATPAYSSNMSTDPLKFNLSCLDGTFADSEMTFNFTEDGRLRGVNSSLTGGGGKVLKSAIAVGVAGLSLFSFKGLDAIVKVEKEQHEPDIKAVCEYLASINGDKPLTLNYASTISHKDFQARDHAGLEPLASDLDLYDKLKAALPQLSVKWSTVSNSHTQRVRSLDPKDHTAEKSCALMLNETKTIELEVQAQGKKIWSDTVNVPDTKTYSLPIPRSALFGSQAFSLSLSGSGAVTSVMYKKGSGAVDALGSSEAVLKALLPNTVAEQAAEEKAKADLIAQQQRVVSCMASPSTCK